jgi:hypothetical protein
VLAGRRLPLAWRMMLLLPGHLMVLAGRLMPLPGCRLALLEPLPGRDARRS